MRSCVYPHKRAGQAMIKVIVYMRRLHLGFSYNYFWAAECTILMLCFGNEKEGVVNKVIKMLDEIFSLRIY